MTVIEDNVPALFRRYPVLETRLPRAVLTHLPTPVQPLRQLGRELGGAELWIKRDDLSGELYGGNKPRKLEFILGEAIADGKRTVLTTGGLGTHHGLATAICARAVGLKTILALLQQPVTEAVRHSLLLDFAAGAELHWASSIPKLTARALRLCAREALRGELPFIIGTGGSSAAGTIGFVSAGFELAGQIAAGELPEPSHVFVALGSGGTVAGLTLGLALAGLKTRVVAVVVTDILPPSRPRLCRMAGRSLGRLRQIEPAIPNRALVPEDIEVIAGYVGPGYGHPTQAGTAARDLMRDLEGVELESTYTAKCLAAVMDAARARRYGCGPLLFWNTYSSVDLAERLGPLPDYHELPHPFHRFFEGPAVPA